MKLPPQVGFTQTFRLGLQLPVSDGVTIDADFWNSMSQQIDAGLGGSEAGAAWWDDFIGVSSPSWTSTLTGSGTGALVSGRNGWYKMSTGGATGASTLNFGGSVFGVDPTSNPVFGVGMCFDTTWNGNATVQIGMSDSASATGLTGFVYQNGGATNYWQCDGGSSLSIGATTQVTPVPITFSLGTQTPTWLQMQFDSVNQVVSFYVTPVTAYNVPGTTVLIGTQSASSGTFSTSLLQPFISISSSGAAVAQNLYLDYVYLTADR